MILSRSEIENIGISTIVILDRDDSGDLYMENLFPLWSDLVVFTVEGKYPTNPVLRERVLEEMRTNPKLICILYGARSEQLDYLLSQRRLHMSQILKKELVSGINPSPGFKMDEKKIVALCRAFAQGFDSDRQQSYNGLLDDLTVPESVKWHHNLIRS